MNNSDEDYYITQDNIAMMQLRKILLLSYDNEIYSDHLEFKYKDENWSIYVTSGNNLNLGKEDGHSGTQIYLYDVQDVSFRQEDNCIFINYTRKNKEYEFNIGKAQSLYIRDFPDCVSDDSDNNNSE